MIKLVLSDVDGTLTNSKRILSTRATEAIRAVQERGITVSLVSGNVIPVMYSFRTYIGLTSPLFAENGGSMIDDSIHSFFSIEGPLKFFNELKDHGLARGIMTNQWRLCSMGFDPAPGKEKEIAEMASLRGLSVTNSGFSWHILNRGQHKGFALNHLISAFDLRPDQVLVMGDNYNDLPMFRDEVRKAVPSNAEDALKEMADYVAKAAYGDGSVEILSMIDSF